MKLQIPEIPRNMTALKKPIPFGKYVLLERINVGGMAEVFKAKTFGVEGFERLLAVKRILPNIAEDEEFITMFIDEAKIAVQLQHANIAQIFDLGKVDDSFFIALEYVHGKDLRSIFDRMRSKGETVPIPLACHVVMQVCEGLDYAHNKRDGQGRELHLIHRDISPQNVLIGFEGEVKLIDFGIAKAAGKASTTQAGILKGKFGYMSPEQVRGLPIDKRSDIFAVGIVLYELLTGERLFVGETDFSTLEKVRNVEIVSPSSYNKKIPQELERLIMKALARDPEDRYQNAIDLHDDLQSFLYSVGEFFSRKDLSGWMKKSFAAEIEEDNAKHEQFQQVAAPVSAPPLEASRKAAVAGLPAGRPGGASMRMPSKPPEDKRAQAGASKPGKEPKLGKDGRPNSAMGWDDEELDTQIFDKEEERTIQADDLFFEDDERTVANEPPPDVLEAARPPELDTPRPDDGPLILSPEPDEPSEEISLRLTPPPAAARRLPPPPARKPTLVGLGAGKLPSPPPPAGPTTLRPAVVPLPPPPSPTAPGRAGLRRSGYNMPPAPAAAPQPAAPRFSVPPPTTAPFGSGSFVDPVRTKPARGGLYAVAGIAVLAAAAGGFYMYSSANRPGRIELTTLPADATVLIDNVKVGDKSPVSVEKPPGPYTLSVTRDGYVRNDQNIEVKTGQPLPLAVTLEPSPDTGFEFTSEPPGGLVWLDGAPINGASGQQARTDFRAFRIPPGHHVLEIKGEARFKPWRQDVEIEPGAIRKIHAVLIPAGAAGAAAKTPPPIAQAPTPSAPPPPAATPPSATPPPPSAPPSPPPMAKKAGSSGSTSPGSSGGGSASPGGASSGSGTTSPGGASSGGGPIASGGARRKRRELPEESAGGGEEASAKATEGGDCSITVNSIPWSEVWIDAKNTSKHTPLVDFKIPCGRHKLAFKRPDMQIDHVETINVRPGQNFKQRYTLEAED
jgi:eukaryotic-like serine/threonine-protein kinase